MLHGIRCVSTTISDSERRFGYHQREVGRTSIAQNAVECAYREGARHELVGVSIYCPHSPGPPDH